MVRKYHNTDNKPIYATKGRATLKQTSTDAYTLMQAYNNKHSRLSFFFVEMILQIRIGRENIIKPGHQYQITKLHTQR